MLEGDKQAEKIGGGDDGGGGGGGSSSGEGGSSFMRREGEGGCRKGVARTVRRDDRGLG